MRDPVCGMPVKKADQVSIWLGCPYFFCSIDCKHKFELNPAYYLSESARGA